jgi:hypothetical protein
MSNQEHVEHHPESTHTGHERPRELGAEPKQSPERHSENEAHTTHESARNEAIQAALRSKEQGKEKRTHQAARHNAAHLVKGDREESFEQTMEEVRHDLPRSTRGFSRFIHNPTIERISEILGNTVARPDAILAGGITAFIVVLGLYFYAKYAGFTLRGSETILAFVAGWLLGILFDFFKTMFTGKR